VIKQLETNKNRQTVLGLDAIRFVCAIWVVIGHFSPPPILEGIGKSTLFGFIINGVYSNLWSGPSAVIVFFVISGFCIHYPQSNQLKIVSIPSYFLRRYIRIGIPLVIAIILSQFLKVKLYLFNDSILWSLVAELIYYTIYPVILKIRQLGFSWLQMFFISFIAALLVAMTNPSAGNYPSFGIGLNWILGFPCWILGVQLAELVFEDNEPKPKHIWLWRMSVWGSSVVCSILRYHSPVKYPWTLNFFAVLVLFWLLQEIRLYRYEIPPKILEWGGRWSYSLYLIHVLAQSIWLSIPQVNLGNLINWVVNMMFILILSYVFALLIEFPSHKLARTIGKLVASKTCK
jgi:peptidoglycan/LPS O-acetylase OafA/YrhL